VSNAVQPAESRASWDGDPPHRRAARERLIAAAGRCIVRDGLASTGIAAVAAEAGVSRPTVYRYFEDRHDLILATLIDTGRTLGSGLSDHICKFADPARMAVEAQIYVLAEVSRSPLMAEVWNSTLLDAAMLADITSPAIIGLARDAIVEIEIAAGWNDREATEAVELMLRFLLTLLVAPAPRRSRRELRSFLERRMIPALGL
jgi:AcrR family transcriptional regulator